MEIEQTIRDLPKVELHIHTLGSIRPGTLLAVIEDAEVDAPYESVEDIEDLFQFMEGKIQAVIGNSGLRKIVSSYFLTPFSGSHL